MLDRHGKSIFPLDFLALDQVDAEAQVPQIIPVSGPTSTEEQSVADVHSWAGLA